MAVDPKVEKSKHECLRLTLNSVSDVSLTVFFSALGAKTEPRACISEYKKIILKESYITQSMIYSFNEQAAVYKFI